MASRNTPFNPLADKAASFGNELADRASQAKDSISDAASTAQEQVADYVRTHDANQIIKDVETTVRNNPGPALLVAALFGFVLGLALTRS